MSDKETSSPVATCSQENIFRLKNSHRKLVLLKVKIKNAIFFLYLCIKEAINIRTEYFFFLNFGMIRKYCYARMFYRLKYNLISSNLNVVFSECVKQILSEKKSYLLLRCTDTSFLYKKIWHLNNIYHLFTKHTRI